MLNEKYINTYTIIDGNISSSDIDDSREGNYRPDTITISDMEEKNSNTHIKNTNNINIYRYKFMDDFTTELFKFAKIHQYDHRKDFKTAWITWTEENEDIINSETRRLQNLCYDGDIKDKMFKSARYYFRKKSTVKKIPNDRRKYVGVQKDLLDSMDEHIKVKLNDPDYKPSDGFDEFCKNNIELLKEEINILCNNGFTDSVEIKKKIKKTYKNRYYMFISK